MHSPRTGWLVIIPFLIGALAAGCGSENEENVEESESGSDTWLDDEQSPYCDTWSLSDVEVFIEEPTLLEHDPQGGVFCVFDSKAHVTSGAGTAVVELRITAVEGSEDFERFAAAANGTSTSGGGFVRPREDERNFETFTSNGIEFVMSGPTPSGSQISYAYAALVDGNTWRANVVRPEPFEGDEEQQARDLLGKKAEEFGAYVAQ